ncbi:IclR family transcriptional regulator [Polaromonas jejuensis]|uniref:IclR family transcriptional regulator n=1 Tax=Polaromonas jejuensis TaxID=457502 RepID=A0ABW0Q7K7_9BURK|nr:IclR family transcriptional regulator [Polaromonas jejuensis]
MSKPRSTANSDAGSLERALHLVRLLATAGERGFGLTDLARLTQLPHPTVHRLLQRLQLQKMVRQVQATRRYALGPLAFELGLAAAQQYDIRGACHPSLLRISQEIGDTAYLVVRSGFEAVCIDRQEGPSPIRVFTLDIGSRRPLGLGAAGLAILSDLPDDERAGITKVVTPLVLGQGKLPEFEFLASIDSCRRHGYAYIRNRVTLGVSAVGVAIRDALGQTIGAISVAAVDSRMSQQRVASIARLLHREAKAIQRALKEGRGFTYD